MRCFVASFPSRDSVRTLIDARPVIPGVTPVPPFSLHLTLLFLGERSADEAAAASQVVARLNARPFTAIVDGLDGFPNPHRARVVVARLRAEPRLTAWRSFLTVALGGDAASFVPHVTLGRARRAVPVEETGELAGVRLAMSAPALYESRSDRGGVRYLPI